MDWFLFALLSAVFAALTTIFAKIGLQTLDSDFATLFRTVVLLIPLTAMVCLRGKWVNPLAIDGKTALFLTLSGLATGASWICFFRALKTGGAAQVLPVDKSSVILVAIGAVVILGERPSLREWVGILLVAAGVVVIGLKR